MYDDPHGIDETLLDKAIRFKNELTAFSTGHDFAGGDEAYGEARALFCTSSSTKKFVPDFVRRNMDLGSFWQWIKYERSTYAERRLLLNDAFFPLIEFLEGNSEAPIGGSVEDALRAMDAEAINDLWAKAFERRDNDPEGAITSARSLLESTCKHILDELDVEYGPRWDLPKLWSETAKRLNLSPTQHEEDAFKAILGACQTIVNNLGTLRNKIGDAHGKGRRAVKPKTRHAELVVHLAGTMAAFLVSTYKAKV